uniref:Uncharacterized protein n=1 Tax=Arundo donax TaxID=35708 RepID=A0A0A9CI22_ARUDO
MCGRIMVDRGFGLLANIIGGLEAIPAKLLILQGRANWRSSPQCIALYSLSVAICGHICSTMRGHLPSYG